MAPQFDPNFDVNPALQNRSARGPSVAQLRAAITGSAQAASYPSATLDVMTKNDLLYVVKLHNISVAGV